jgi:hypothetical protein
MLVFLIESVTVIGLSRLLSTNLRFFIPEIKKSYSGRIIDKYNAKTSFLKTRKASEIVEAWNISNSLLVSMQNKRFDL